MTRKKFITYIITSQLLLAGCSPLLTPTTHYPPARPINVIPPPKTNGTIYQAGYESRLFPDRVAYRIGDILTIKLEEKTKGEYKAKTNTDKRASVDYPVPTLFGRAVEALKLKASSQQRFDGTGKSDQSNNLSGTVTVTVTDVMSNNNLCIQGESWVTINQGQEFVQLTGIVRPEDIRPDNVVSSQRVASANINYGARGQAGYSTSGGIATKIMNRFFPY